MPGNGNHQEFPECFQFPEAVRLLWEGTQKAVEEGGMAQSDLDALCDIVVRLADHRLMLIEACGSSPGSEKVMEQVRHYRELASHWLRSAAVSPPEPDWGGVAEKLRSAITGFAGLLLTSSTGAKFQLKPMLRRPRATAAPTSCASDASPAAPSAIAAGG